MAKNVVLEIVTPSKLFYMGEAEMVIVRTLTGAEGFMANHSWACKLLDTGELWIREAGAKDFRIAAVSGGFICVKESIIIFTDAAEWPAEIDVDRAMNEKGRAMEWLKSATGETDKNDVLRAKIAISKSLTRMTVANGGTRKKY
jgi:F-type H+-transporting ATPase subunit epsilon